MSDESHYTVFTNAFGETSFSSSGSGGKDKSPTTMKKGIMDPRDVEKFTSSDSAKSLLSFLQDSCDAVVGKQINGDDYPINPAIGLITSFNEKLRVFIDDIPPLKQNMRYGNKAFRQWHQRMCVEAAVFARDLLSLRDEAVNDSLIDELCAYITTSYGNEVRIDYGTGHELNMFVFFFCLRELGIVKPDDGAGLILRGFASYISTMRKLQGTYYLEPAGSHGVWGLDDYHCLSFVLGAAQLCGHPIIKPESIHDKEILEENSQEFLYLEGIHFIKKLKAQASFAETSPMLNDISFLPDWVRVTTGLIRLFQGEVLGKFPVVQHLPFGMILKCTWEPTPVDSTRGSSHFYEAARGAGMGVPSVMMKGRPPPIHSHATAAPWAAGADVPGNLHLDK